MTLRPLALYFICGILGIANSAVADSDPRIGTEIDVAISGSSLKTSPIRTFIHTLHIAGQKSYYGALFPYSIDETDPAHPVAHFATAAHLIPADPANWPKLLVFGALSGDKLVTPKIVGVDPGTEVAAVDLPLDGVPRETIERFKVLLKIIFAKKTERLTSGSYRDLFMIGRQFGGGLPVDAVQMNEFDDWNRLVTESQAATKLDLPIIQQELRKPKYGFDQGTEMRVASKCPAPLLDLCYAFLGVSMGYSGGIVGQKVRDSASGHVFWQVLGMVTHFSFLTPYTFVTPIDLVIATAERIRRNPGLAARDQDGWVEFIGMDRFKVLKGQYANTVIRSTGYSTIAGPGDPGGGGPGDPGGGGPLASLNHMAQFEIGPYQGIPGVESLIKISLQSKMAFQPSLLEALGNLELAWEKYPNMQLLKGISNFAWHRPGFLLNDKVFYNAATFDLSERGTPNNSTIEITSLRDFLDLLRSGKKFALARVEPPSSTPKGPFVSAGLGLCAQFYNGKIGYVGLDGAAFDPENPKGTDLILRTTQKKAMPQSSRDSYDRMLLTHFDFKRWGDGWRGVGDWINMVLLLDYGSWDRNAKDPLLQDFGWVENGKIVIYLTPDRLQDGIYWLKILRSASHGEADSDRNEIYAIPMRRGSQNEFRSFVR